MSLTVAFTLLAVTASCLGSLPLVRHESRRALPPHWEQSHRAPANSVLPLRIGLAQSNLDRIEEFLLDVSHPESQNYGNHWSAAKIAETFRPSMETVDAVRGWLEQEGIDRSRIRLSPSRGWLGANVSVSEAEQLLKTEYHVYNHVNASVEHIACASGYHVPEHLSKHVDIITPTIHFDGIPNGQRTSMRKREVSIPGKRPGQQGFKSRFSKITGTLQHIVDELENCDAHITPTCIRALYGFVYEPLVPERNTVGIVEYATQAYLGSDLDLFFQNFSTSQIGQRPKLVSIDGGVIQTDEVDLDSNLESSLDLQYSMGLVGKKQPVTLFQVGDAVESASFNNFLDALDGTFCSFEGGDDPTIDAVYPDPAPEGYKGKDCGTAKAASVISSSYSLNEGDITPAYAARQCAEYGKLGLMGVTFLYASGDWGVAGGPGDNDSDDPLCLFPNGTQSADAKGFNPTFPASCPFVTGVGATRVLPGKNITDPEVVAHGPITSGGGFSTYFAAPDYQKAAVHDFLTEHHPPYSADVFNSPGRGFPDISVNGANYVVAVDGKFVNVWGTSASSPVLAAILSAINDARLAAGKSTIGFINPVIYSAKFRDAFNDINNGSNPGCGTDGFSAVEGWDPVTGLGTPNFPKLLAKWLLLP